jgi:hypothetical protein
MYNKSELENALKLLGKILELKKTEPVNLFIGGGAALIVLEFVSRTTKDVDIVAIGKKGTSEDLVLQLSKPLPEYLKKAAIQTAHDLKMDENWLNPGPTDLFKYGLPDGFMDRVTIIRYSSVLTVYFFGRFDEICFKLYAAADQGAGKHVDDLRSLNPTGEEIEKAARWAMTHDPSEGFRIILKDMMRKLGYEKASDRI